MSSEEEFIKEMMENISKDAELAELIELADKLKPKEVQISAVILTSDL